MPLPASTVLFYNTTLTDTHPITGVVENITMANKMVSFLSNVAPVDPTIRGFGPNGKALWWPNFQERHKTSGLFWVQGHLLNDNVYGPGEPRNLVPISNTLNTNMLNLVEKEVKKAVNTQGKYVRYEVNAHWDQTPTKTREVYGITGIDADGSLNWGEQFAPTRLSWTLHELILNPHTNILNSSPMLHGSPWYDDSSQWNNHFPS